ncbi:Membrane carboxypeptidase (penicillin-binding protein) [Streptomyces zhaozhouensis]|uniref:Membrane carboxypeptidase (Penicillin-binding protein) n=1 Tax=Streptomyces zhaozhouensis TaxID=1300267 RepID=A0A286DYM4_9ACTN|nr:transglycosylase domain-containing protein [Streptomyces zhaozhouensis]SOD63767.1 Membrane carboxypeptidase (penicillin-binding protein) [Streptomyces zhaozhouensis]
MSEHRRKPPQSRGRRAASSGRRAEPPPPPPPQAPSGESEERAYGSRAEARRAAQRGGRRRAANASAGAAGAAAAEGASGGRRRRAEPTGRKRLIDYPRADKRGVRRWVPSWKQVLGSTVAFFGLLVGLVGLAYAMTEIPDPNELAKQQSNVYYWADGERMVVSGGEVNRQEIPYEEIPEAMRDSVVAAENATFWEDSGIDPMGIGRAVLNMARGGDVQSGSTITQQYVKNMYLTQDQTLERKGRELLLSIKVGAEYSKQDILAGYLNSSYYGRGAHGIQAAAQAYFGIDAADLDPSQAAFLTNVLKGPSLYDPYNLNGELDEGNQQRAEERWQYVLDRRLEVGNLSQAEYDEINEFPEIQEPSPAMEKEGQIGYLTSLVDNYLISQDIVPEDKLAKGGYQIHTTFDREKMEQMEAAVTQVEEEHIDPEARDEDRHVQFGGASVVPGDGAIVAIYGGAGYPEHYVNNADSPNAQVGSTFKPFVLAAAMQEGIRDPEGGPEQGRDERIQLSPESVYLSEDGLKINKYNGDTLLVEDAETGEDGEWHQANFEGRDQGEVTLREAMEVSANSPFVQLGMDIGPATVSEIAQATGLLEDSLGPANDSVPSFALGVSTPGPIRMATAYATFAASGERADPYSVTSVDMPDGSTWEHPNETERALEAAVADNVNDVLQSVVEADQGSGHRIVEEGFDKPVAGKTGTTDDNKSAWFVGYTPHLSTAVGMWRIADDQEDLREDEEAGFMSMYDTAGMDKINGSSLPLSVWLAYMKEATAGDDPTAFPEPPEIGETIWGGGAESPPPVETEEPPPPTETDEPDAPEETEETEEPPPPTDTDEPEPDPTETCEMWDPNCEDSSEGGANEGTDPGTDNGGSEGGDDEGQDGGEDNGGPGGGAIWGREGN